LGEADFRGAKSRLAAELRMFIIDVHDMRIDADTAEFVTDRAGGLVAKIEDVISERELNRIESDLGRLQVVVHQALKRKGNLPASGGMGGKSDG
jgi:hypothetical protein